MAMQDAFISEILDDAVRMLVNSNRAKFDLTIARLILSERFVNKSLEDKRMIY